MSSLADLPELVGFFSYSREDDAGAFGALSALRDRIQHELRAQLGRTPKTFRIWQDKEAIPSGTLWETEIKNAVAQAVFFIPIITPTVVSSPYCRFELEAFLAREGELGRDDLVFPILYIDVPALDDDTRRKDDPVLSLIAKRQYVDWRRLRHRDVRTTEAGEAVELFCRDIRDALRRSWLSPEERTAQEKFAALQRAEDERKRQEAETRRQEEETRKRVAVAQERERADQEQRQREAEAERRSAEERRLREEAQAKRRAAEEQRRAENEERRRQQEAGARSLWPSSRRALAVGLVVCLLLFGTIGVWLASPPPAPVPVKEPTPSPVAPSAPVATAPAPVTQSPPTSTSPASNNPAPITQVPTPPATPTPAPEPTPAPTPAAPTKQATNAPLSLAQERALRPGDTFQECRHCPVMMVVPTGSFMMGSPASEPGRKSNEGPQHRVTIGHRFAVGQYELTFDEWDACVVDSGCNDYKPDDRGWGRGRRPLINVSWNDAQAYVAWLAKKAAKPYRLLSEAEYEYATRAGTTTAYPWGDAAGKNNANCSGCGSQWNNETAPVGSFAANRFGLYDMVGNVVEWTEDCWNDSYNGAPTDGSAWTNGACSERVLRGASWINYPVVLRSAGRGDIDLTTRFSTIGFRVARTLVGH